MTEMYVKKGATEIEVFSIKGVRWTEKAVDSAEIKVKKGTDISEGDPLTIYDSSNEAIISGRVVSIEKQNMWVITIYGHGYELNNEWVTNIYENKSPEYIVEDIITNYTDLTYSSTHASGITLDKHPVDNYAYKVIEEMRQLLGWQTRTEPDKTFYFEPEGSVYNGVSWNTTDDIGIPKWIPDPSKQFNSVTVKGGKSIYSTSETFTASGGQTEFNLSHKPTGGLRIEKNSTELEGGAEGSGDYDTFPEEKRVQLTTGASEGDTIEVSYDYEVSIKIEAKDHKSTEKIGKLHKSISAPWLKTFAQARRYGKNLIETYKDPLYTCKVLRRGIERGVSTGERILVEDFYNDIKKQMSIKKIIWYYPKRYTEIEMGQTTPDINDWQIGVLERLTELEKSLNSADVIRKVILMNSQMDVVCTETHVRKKRSPKDTFILGHPTLGRLRSSLEMEPDCSGTENHGTWSGSGVSTGAEYTTDEGLRLGCAEFDGFTRYVRVPSNSSIDLTGAFTLCFALKIDSNPSWDWHIISKYTSDLSEGYCVYLDDSRKINAYIYNGVGGGVSTNTVIPLDTWVHVFVVFDGTNLKIYLDNEEDTSVMPSLMPASTSMDLYIGRLSHTSGKYMNGYLDEVRIYDVALSPTDRNKIYERIQVTADQKLYLSFDNPRIGDRYGAWETIGE